MMRRHRTDSTGDGEECYVSELIADGTDEAEERRRNLQEPVTLLCSTRRKTRRAT